jgi:hypothetical protein
MARIEDGDRRQFPQPQDGGRRGVAVPVVGGGGYRLGNTMLEPESIAADIYVSLIEP